MQSCPKVSMGSWPALCTQNSSTHYTIHHFVLATKQTLLSVLLANHAFLCHYVIVLCLKNTLVTLALYFQIKLKV